MNRDEPRCAQCGEAHPRDELELAFRRPDVIAVLTETQRFGQRVRETDDLCEYAGEFFVRAVLPLPVEGWDEPYCIGLWVKVDRRTFDRVLELWDDPAQSDEPPFDAVISNEIPTLPQTVGLRVHLQLTAPTSRPYALVPACAHPLHREQSAGITAHRASEYSSLFA
ncbi:MAG TPA: DUF2199 domain-containing protein [Burkholderiales bacterium]|nr:DUF2199 domain-containing protein [Burkholderiales bacterium]